MAKFTRPMKTPDNWRELVPHPLAQITEFGKGINIEGFAGHIQNGGYDDDEPIVLIWVPERNRFEILDGRHKQDASIKAEVEPTFAEFIGKNPERYVLKKLFRQHFNEGYLGLIAAEYAKLGRGKKPENSTNSNASTEAFHPISIGKAAQMFNVSDATVERAKTVIANGVPELRKAVERGDISVSAAANLSKKPEKEQKKIVKSMEVKRCNRCIEKKIDKLCPVCVEMQTPKDPRPTRYKAPKFDWLKFNKAIQILRRCLDDLASHGKAERRVPALRILDSFEKDVQSWEKSIKDQPSLGNTK